MPDASELDSEAVPQATAATSVSGGVNLDAGRDVTIGGDVVGRDKITTIGYTVEQVSSLLTQISSTFQFKPFDGRCPYMGLDAFTEDDADRFFGRETLIDELVGRVKGSRFVVIAGPSGSGKSSLVRAGLLHALKQGALPNSDRWLYATLTPGRDTIDSLASAMSRMKSPEVGDYLRQHSKEADALHKCVESTLSDRKDQRAVIFVDQFEEVFTQVSKEDERAAFLNLLTHAATLENGRVTVLFAMRSDFVSNCAMYSQLNALLNQQFMQVGAMQPDELVSAIARPALQVGLRIDPDLVAQIVNDMQDEPGALPLMQFALKDLFDAQQAKGGVIALTVTDYLARGGLRKALERHADAAFARLSESEQQLARTIFSGLIEIGRGTQDTRRTAAFDELVPASVDAIQVKSVVQKLADARLITTDESSNRDTVTISHERLIEAWPWLQRLVNENRDAIALQNQIAEDAREWDLNKRDASYLYSGARLATAREQSKAQTIALSGLAQAFVESSIRRARQQRLRQITAAVAVVVVAMACLFGFAVLQSQRAEESDRSARQLATSEAGAIAAKSTAQADAARAEKAERLALARLLTAQGQKAFNDQPLLALRLALEGLAMVPADNSLAQSVAADAVRSVAQYGRLLNLGDDVADISTNPDGSLMIVSRIDKPGEVRHVLDNRLVEELPGRISRMSLYGETPPAIFVIEYADAPAELRRSSDFSLVGKLEGHVDEVAYSVGHPPAYLAIYYTDGNAPSMNYVAEVRRTTDASVVTRLTSQSGTGALRIDFGSAPDTSRFVVTYAAPFMDCYSCIGCPPEALDSCPDLIGLEDALYNAVTGEFISNIVDLSGSDIVAPDEIKFSSNPGAAYFVALYRGNTQLRRSADGKVITDVVIISGTQSLPARRIAFSPDSNATYFTAYYDDDRVEVRRSADGALIRQHVATVVHFAPEATAAYYMVHSQTMRQGEVYRTADGALITQFMPDDSPLTQYGNKLVVTRARFSPDPKATYFFVEYANLDPQGLLYFPWVVEGLSYQEMRYATTGAQVSLTHNISFTWAYFSTDAEAAYFVVDYENGHGELRRTADNSVVDTLTGDVVQIEFSPDNQASYFIVDYADAPSELRRTVDGSIITTFSGQVDRASFYAAPETGYVIARYRNGPAPEMTRVADGASVPLTGDIVSDSPSFSPDPASRYFVISYVDGRGELWDGEGTPHRVAVLGLNLAGHAFGAQNKRLAVWHLDHVAYLLDIDWLTAMGGDLTLVLPKELARLACDGPFASGLLDEALLKPYLEDRSPQVCR